MGKVTSLGHVGIFVNDYPMMRDFYTRVLGFTITDEDETRGMCFLSAQPESEHHELLLAGGRKSPSGTSQVQQLSFHTDSIQSVREFREVFAKENVTINSEVTHGNTVSVYFEDPEGNRLEVYYTIPVDWHQPFREPIDFSLDDEGLMKQINDMTFGAQAKS